MFFCETKRGCGFVRTVCKNLGWNDRWFVVDLDRMSGGLFLGWAPGVIIHQIVNRSFSIELEFETGNSGGKLWAIFVYASTKDRVCKEQWGKLLARKNFWENRWVLGEDLNDICNSEEKKGGRIRTEASCKDFRDFIAGMEMEEIGFQGK